MATLLSARNLAKTYATHTLFTGVALSIHDGERLALIGPNGSGKSTLLKILAELETPDDGEFTRKKNLQLAYVAQDDPFPDDATSRSAVVDRLAHQPGHSTLDPDTSAAIVLSKLGFTEHDRPVKSLSGGWKKRLSIACALATDPDVLMLDEPTNHLDLEGVIWLEKFVKQNTQTAMVFITHDRTFLESTATRIVELSRAYPGGTFEAKGNYSEFLRRKNDFLDAQAAQQNAMAGKVRRDNAWLKQGVQGRQTRNKSQVSDTASRRAELKNITNRNDAPKQTATIDFQATDRKTNRLLAAHNVSKTLGDKKLFENLELELSPGMRLGLLGPNGSGKTTLLRLLTGKLKPDSGSIKPAAELRIVEFTQHREALNPTEKLREALCPVGDTVDYRGKPLHVASWAKKFLFDPSKFNTSVGDLSGGEQARVLIANLMLKPADVLILDEPTNDLDIPSLEVLEQALTEFPGAIVLVTHDRFMLDRLSTQILALDGQGGAKTYASYPQWIKGQAKRSAADKAANNKKAKKTSGTEGRDKNNPNASDSSLRMSKNAPQGHAASAASAPPTPKKLTFKLQHELDGMESAILAAEAELEQHQAAAAPKVIADHEKHAEACQKLGEAQTRVDTLYTRWAELEKIAAR